VANPKGYRKKGRESSSGGRKILEQSGLLGIQEFGAPEGVEELWGSFNWHGLWRVVGVGSEGVGPGSEHALSEGGAVSMPGDAEVSEHGVGFPTAKELDDVRVDASAKESGGTARAEAARAEQFGVDAGEVLNGASRVTEGVGDELGLGDLRVAGPIIVGADGSVGEAEVRA
jgi:hypothetical protein